MFSKPALGDHSLSGGPFGNLVNSGCARLVRVTTKYGQFDAQCDHYGHWCRDRDAYLSALSNGTA